MAKIGAPALKHDPEMFSAICAEVAAGDSLRTVLAQGHYISAPTFYKWIRDNETFAKQYARATEDRADTIFDEMMEIADDATNDWMEKQRPDGSTYEVLNAEHVQRSRLRIETRKWALGKMRPKKYGDKIEHDHGGKLTITLPTGSDAA